jgi:hypothetical protein
MWRLPDLLKPYGALYFAFGKLFEQLNNEVPENPNEPIGEHGIARIEFILKLMATEARELDLRAVSFRIERFSWNLKKETPFEECKHDLKILGETIQDETIDRHFLYVPENASLYRAKQLFGKAVYNAFPSSRFDIQEAGTAICLGLYTASVFHLMRAVEHAMRALAWDRRAKLSSKGGKSIPLDMATWEEVLRTLGIEIDKVTTWPKSKGEVRVQATEFYGSALAEIRAIKDAWRNHIMHARRHYTEKDAGQIVSHVERLMVTLATRISEEERTPKIWNKGQLR